ncbi:MAG: UDP-glucose 4-epimerase [Solirubrobacterales bacterium]|nr:UDP-glucose 4-epimerase [Solirubrobacterales bacterium]
MQVSSFPQACETADRMQVQKAIVTGGAGFIGSHLVDRLIAEGASVVAIDDLSTGREDRVASEADLEILDIVDFPALERVTEAVRPDAIFHLAAQASVTVSVTDPWRDLDVNVKGTMNVAQAARSLGTPVVFSSTGGAIYGNEAPIPTPETYPPEPVAPYGASKWAAEAYLRTWSVADGIPHAVCRLGNAYGPRQSPHGEAGVVAIFSHRLWAGEPATLFGHGDATRDYVYAGDIAAALLRAAGVAGVFNIATGSEVPVSEIFERLREVAGVDSEPILAPLRAGELERSGLDSTRAAETLGWSAEVPLERGLEQTYRALVEEFEA